MDPDKRSSNIWFQGVAIAFVAVPILLFGFSVPVVVSVIAGACSFCFWIGKPQR